jgi:nucleoid-associated protein YgaU
MSPDQVVILGTGATQTVDARLVNRLKEKWVREGKLVAAADEAAVLRAFVEQIERWAGRDTSVIEYTVKPGDTWTGIAGRFLGDQTRFREIIAFNQLPPDAPLMVNQTLRIPPR